jgi:hypothetical protein
MLSLSSVSKPVSPRWSTVIGSSCLGINKPQSFLTTADNRRALSSRFKSCVSADSTTPACAFTQRPTSGIDKRIAPKRMRRPFSLQVASVFSEDA